MSLQPEQLRWPSTCSLCQHMAHWRIKWMMYKHDSWNADVWSCTSTELCSITFYCWMCGNCTITSVSYSISNVLIQYTVCSSVEYRRLTVEHKTVWNLLHALVNMYGSNSQWDTSVSCNSLIWVLLLFWMLLCSDILMYCWPCILIICNFIFQLDALIL